MAAALQEVADRGYEGASLTRVAARAGVAKGLVWHYFAGKDDLMGATARAAMEALRADVVAGIDLDRPVPDVIRAALRAAAALVRTRRDELVALNRIVHNLRRAGGEDVAADFYEETHCAQEELFRRGQARAACAGSTRGSWRSPTRAPSTRCSPTSRRTPTSIPGPTRRRSPRSCSTACRPDAQGRAGSGLPRQVCRVRNVAFLKPTFRNVAFLQSRGRRYC